MFDPLRCSVVWYIIPLIRCVEWMEYKGLWYYISENKIVEYIEAIQICESMNAHLAVITHAEQNDFIKSVEGINDDRWIGMSNNGTLHNHLSCQNTTWFWNSDNNCTNSFTPATFMHRSSSDCAGIATTCGVWTARRCSEKLGYICQWECKRFHLTISLDEGSLNGIYEFDAYLNGHVCYKQRRSYGRIKIFRKHELSGWVIQNDYYSENAKVRAIFQNALYVPYDHNLSWNSINNQSLTSSILCVECETLDLCISYDKPMGMPKCIKILLNDVLTEYRNNDSKVFIKKIPNSEACICMPTRMSCGQRCGYFFPYPHVTTNVTLRENAIVTITNLCIDPWRPLITTRVSTYGASLTQQQNTSPVTHKLTTITQIVDKELQPNKLAAIIAPAVCLVIIIIAVAAIIIIILRIRRKRNQNSKPYLQSKGKPSPQLEKHNNKRYIEYDDPLKVNSVEPAYAECKVDVHTPNESNAVYQKTHVSDTTIGDPVNPGIDIYSKEKPVGTYLASDYGVLMNNLKEQKIQEHLNPQTGYDEVTNADSYIQECKQNNALVDSLAMHDNIVSASGNDNILGTTRIEEGADTQNHDDCEYYNISRNGLKCDGEDDDLELFENTVYGHP